MKSSEPTKSYIVERLATLPELTPSDQSQLRAYVTTGISEDLCSKAGSGLLLLNHMQPLPDSDAWFPAE